jgi:hypothetical protein
MKSWFFLEMFLVPLIGKQMNVLVSMLEPGAAILELGQLVMRMVKMGWNGNSHYVISWGDIVRILSLNPLLVVPILLL